MTLRASTLLSSVASIGWVILASFVSPSTPAQAQCSPHWETFPAGDGDMGDFVDVVFADDAGPHAPALYAGGDFLHAGPTPANHIAKWDGTSWSALSSGMNGRVSALALFDDDGGGPHPVALYAGGAFSTAGGQSANRVAKWTGTSWEALGRGANDWVTDLAVFDDDGPGPNLPALYACGYLTTAGGLGANHVAKWDGSAWSSLGSGTDAVVWTLMVFDEDGSGPNLPALFAGGHITVAGGTPVDDVARWDGASWSATANGGPAYCRSMTVFDPDGPGSAPEVLVAGDGAGMVKTWDGSQWTTLGGVLSSQVRTLTVHDEDGGGPNPPSLFAGGASLFYDGTALHGLGRWNGSTWTSVGGGTSDFDWVLTLAPFDDDAAGPNPARLVAGGAFQGAGGIGGNYIAQWDGASWSRIGTDPNVGTSHDVMALQVFDEDGAGPQPAALCVGGGFTFAGGISARQAAKWDGASWSALGAGPTCAVNSLAVFDDDGAGPHSPKLYAGSAGWGWPGAVWNLESWDGATWTGVGGLGGAAFSDVVVEDMTVHGVDASGPDPARLYVVGSILSAGGQDAEGIARWDGSSWSALPGNPSFWGATMCLAVFDDDGPGPRLPSLIVGGSFTQISGVPYYGVARWNGTAWVALGSGVTPFGDVLAMTVFDDDGAGPHLPALIVGGEFETAGEIQARNIAKWDGTSWFPLGNGVDHFVHDLTVFDDDGTGPNPPALYAGGYFTNAGTSGANRIAKWDGSTWSALDAGTDARVLALEVFDADAEGPGPARLYVGGEFELADGASSSHLAAWAGCGSSIDAICFGDGTGGACPCGNSGAPGRGCDNSAATGGALLTSSGHPSLSVDTLVLTSSGELPSPLSIFLQGNAMIAPAVFGDGLRCAGGALKRLFVNNASGGVVTAPSGSDPTVSQRSSAKGDPLTAGAARAYQVYYRDPNPSFCPAPPGNTWNASSGLFVVWSP